MYTRHDLQDTIVAVATPPGEGAIGVVRLSGPKAVAIADALFRGKRLADQPSHTLHYGTLREGDRIVDEVVVSLFRAPRSYTGEDVVEFSCHGSPWILQRVVELCVAQGARLARPGEFTLRAFLNGRMDLSQAEAVADLIAAQSEQAHDLAMKQMRGGFSKQIRALREELIHFASLIELELDFGEEDVEFADRRQLLELVARIRGLVQRLMDSFRLGNAIRRGVPTVLAGRPNAGKSTLLNALLREERAIVSDIAGTTRDTIEEVHNIRGIAFRLIDTAGIREARDQIEAIGVQKTLEKIRQSNVLVYVFDASSLSANEVAADVERLHADGLEIVAVMNKTDLVPGRRPDDFATPLLPADRIVPVSAKAGTGIDQLEDKLFALVTGGRLRLEDTVVTNARHYEALR
ncbi:MAG: tRNA uridine-5-carboxymethylaminomethyl(34) synthesis GTPase MnmE, partial [Alphaproteobacteria bacterium]